MALLFMLICNDMTRTQKSLTLMWREMYTRNFLGRMAKLKFHKTSKTINILIQIFILFH